VDEVAEEAVVAAGAEAEALVVLAAMVVLLSIK